MYLKLCFKNHLLKVTFGLLFLLFFVVVTFTGYVTSPPTPQTLGAGGPFPYGRYEVVTGSLPYRY